MLDHVDNVFLVSWMVDLKERRVSASDEDEVKVKSEKIRERRKRNVQSEDIVECV